MQPARIVIALLLGLLAYLILCRAPAPTLVPKPTPSPNQVLLGMGRQWGVLSIRTGKPCSTLQQAAEAQAAYQARVQIQGHQNRDVRMANLYRKMPNCNEFKEVVNESWSGQDVNAAANEMYRSWQTSNGHWSAVNGRCNYYGYAMCRGLNGIWYACAIFALTR